MEIHFLENQKEHDSMSMHMGGILHNFPVMFQTETSHITIHG